MLRCSRAVGAKRVAVPKHYASLGTASIGRQWSNIKHYTNEQREDVRRGAWRQTPEVRAKRSFGGGQLGSSVEMTVLEEPDDEEAKMPPSEKEPNAAQEKGASQRSDSEIVTFSTREEALEFQRALEAADWEETHVPLAQLSHAFYADLANVANSELSEVGQAEVSDEEREEQAREIQREFFADFYIAQGVVHETQRSAFLEEMVRDTKSFVVPNAQRVLSRLSLRQQLERHAGQQLASVFRAVPWMDGAFSIFPQVPKEACSHNGMLSSSIPDGKQHSRLVGHKTEAGEQPSIHESESTSQISAESLLDLLLSESAECNKANNSEEEDKSCVSRSVEDSSVMCASDPAAALVPVPSSSPNPTLAQLHWLQRAISSEALEDCDVLGLLAPLLLGYQSGDVVAAIRTRGARMGNGNHGGDYEVDVARHVHSVDQRGEEEGAADAGDSFASRERGCVVVIHRPPDRRYVDNKRPTANTEGSELANLDTAVWPRGGVVQAEQCDPSVLHIATRRLEDVLPPSVRIDSILCAPRVSGDGLRPRVLLSSDARSFGAAPANRGMHVVGVAASRFMALREELLYGLQLLVSPRGQHRLRRLVYAVNSMNPLECEAVVGSALHKLRATRLLAAGQRLTLLKIPEALGLEGGDGNECEMFGALRAGMGAGLDTWMSVEGMPVASEASAIDADLRRSVAEASWRISPMLDHTNGCYLVVVQFEEDNSNNAGESPVKRDSSELCVVSAEQLLIRLGDPPTSDRGVLLAVCPSAISLWRQCQGFCGLELLMAGVLLSNDGGRMLQPRLHGSLALHQIAAKTSAVGPILVVPIHASLLLAFMCSRFLTLRHCQRIIAPSNGGAALSPEDLDHVRQLRDAVNAASQGLREAEHSVVLRCRSDSLVCAHDAQVELHPAVVAELERACVVATLSSSSSTDRGGEVVHEWTLTVPVHEDAFNGEAPFIALRDALSFVLRQLGQPSSAVDATAKWHLPYLSPSELQRRGSGEAAPWGEHHTKRRYHSAEERTTRYQAHKIERLKRRLHAHGVDPDAVPGGGGDSEKARASWRKQGCQR